MAALNRRSGESIWALKVLAGQGGDVVALCRLARRTMPGPDGRAHVRGDLGYAARTRRTTSFSTGSTMTAGRARTDVRKSIV